ncbi:MAG TPA: SpoIIE family protein phosphatase [Acidobacteriota bacterium]|nr:SpoIIE family protein phosphatase [Acidobacteriota bacterium]
MNNDDYSAATILKEKLLYSIQSLTEIGEELSAAEQFESSSRAVLHLLMGTVVISKAAIMVFDEDANMLRISASRGIEDPEITFKISRKLAAAFHAVKEPFPVDNPPNDRLREFFEEHKQDIDNLHSHLWIPLNVKRGFIGAISVSKKFMSGEYEEVDLELLSIIAQQLSIAINTYRLIHSLKTTNFQLNRKILELEILYDLGIAIGTLMEIRELSEQILINAVGLTDASTGMLALKEEKGGRLVMAAGINMPVDDLTEIEGHEELHGLLEKGEPWLDNNADPETTPFGFSKLLIVPLSGQHGIQGLIGLADKESRSGGLLDFTEEDQRLLSNFGSQAGVAIENAKFYAESVEKERLERELQVAASIQRNLLPDSLPEISGFQIAATTLPSRAVGGDHYDYIRRDGKYLIAVADVSGKGIPAALLVSTLHATFHAHSEGEWLLPEMVRKISNSIYACSLSNKFITFALAVLDPEKRIIRSVNAGHNYPLLISRDGGISTLRKGGLALGLLPGSEYVEEEIALSPGDIIVFFTDGITESFNPMEEEYGDERFQKLLVENRHRSAQEIFDAVLQDIKEFVGEAPQHDDLTLLVIKVTEQSVEVT